MDLVVVLLCVFMVCWTLYHAAIYFSDRGTMHTFHKYMPEFITVLAFLYAVFKLL